jgi:hypothetical protein
VIEVADIFREAGSVYRKNYASRMLPSHMRAMRDIEDCRTAVLGGHLWGCDSCGERQYSYHSCRNRHCPKCHGDQTRRWIDSRRLKLLPCPYFLLTFTLPVQLRTLARTQQKLVYGILMSAAAQSILKLTEDSRFLGGRPGLMGVLHTWTRAMLFHPHAHFLVTGGGLAPDRQRWMTTTNPRFLVPGRALSVIFRAKIKHALDNAGLLGEVPVKVWRKKWVVHCQQAGTGEKVLDYLGRYVFRIAIANSRLERFEDGQVTFRYRENRSGEIRRCTLPNQEFIARFLQHVLPRGFAKVRYYGLYSPACKNLLEKSRQLLGALQTIETDPEQPILSPTLHAQGNDEDARCPFCGVGRMVMIQKLPRKRGPPC